MTDNDWIKRAACSGHPHPEIFQREELYDIAKRVCEECPVKTECANAGGDFPGIWGGMTRRERRLLKQKQHPVRLQRNAKGQYERSPIVVP